MRNLLKLFFILVLFLQFSACFAGAREEKDALIRYIFTPINTHFDEKSSSTVPVSRGLINYQKIKKCKLNPLEAERLAMSCTDEECNARRTEYLRLRGNPQPTVSWFGHSSWLVWKLKAANCNENAYLAKFVFEFNRLNSSEQELPFSSYFKNAFIIHTVPGTGQHDFLMVEGKSGTMFVVDDWSSKVEQLDDSFKGLFDSIDYDEDLHIPQELGAKLNELFKVDGYYDEIYVNKNTKWIAKVPFSINLEGFTKEYNSYMKKFYNALRHDGFPYWVSYDDLYYKKERNWCCMRIKKDGNKGSSEECFAKVDCKNE